MLSIDGINMWLILIYPTSPNPICSKHLQRPSSTSRSPSAPPVGQQGGPFWGLFSFHHVAFVYSVKFGHVSLHGHQPIWCLFGNTHWKVPSITQLANSLDWTPCQLIKQFVCWNTPKNNIQKIDLAKWRFTHFIWSSSRKVCSCRMFSSQLLVRFEITMQPFAMTAKYWQNCLSIYLSWDTAFAAIS